MLLMPVPKRAQWRQPSICRACSPSVAAPNLSPCLGFSIEFWPPKLINWSGQVAKLTIPLPILHLHWLHWTYLFPKKNPAMTSWWKLFSFPLVLSFGFCPEKHLWDAMLFSTQAGSRVFQSVLESSALYLQSTADQMPKLLAGHGARVAEEVESLLDIKNEILALTPQLG